MEKDQIYILENRGLISVSGKDAKEYLQNIITNDINKVSESSSIFSALLSPQGKYLFDFFVIKNDDGYLLDCDGISIKNLIDSLSKYKIRSNKLLIANLFIFCICVLVNRSLRVSNGLSINYNKSICFNQSSFRQRCDTNCSSGRKWFFKIFFHNFIN